MARISFRTKIRDVFNADETLSHRIVIVPTLTRHHCDMNAFRRHPKYGSYANSDLFPNVLARISRDRLGKYGHFRMDNVPDGVSVTPDKGGFMHTVEFDV